MSEDNYEIDFRSNLAYKHRREKKVSVVNSDKETVPCYLALYSKGLYNHDSTGMVTKDDMEKLLDSISKNDTSLLSKVCLGSGIKFQHMTSKDEPDLLGRVIGTYVVPAHFPYNSVDSSVQIVELYAMALSRDINFEEFVFPPNEQIASAIGYFLPHAVYYSRVTLPMREDQEGTDW